MTIAFINTKSVSVNALKQKEILSSFFDEKEVEDVVFVEENGFLTNLNLNTKKLVVASLKCLGNDVDEVKSSLNFLMQKKVDLVFVEEEMKFFSTDLLKSFAKGFESALQLKADYSSIKIKNSLQEKKAKGLKIGRACGSKNKKTVCEKHKKYIFQALKNGESVSKIADVIGISPRTLFNYKKEIRLMVKGG